MNLLTVNLTWKNKKSEIISGKTKFANGILALKVERIHDHILSDDNIFHNTKSNITCAIIGYISNLKETCSKYSIDKKNDVEIITDLYSLLGVKFITILEGIFTIFIWDENKKHGYVFQDEYGSNLPIYITNTPSRLILSSSLKEILKQDVVSRELNLSAIRDFWVAKTIVPNNKTFIKGVYKLIPHHYMIIDAISGTFQFKALHYEKKKVSLSFAKRHLIDRLRISIHNLHAQIKSACRICALSAGYDSNTILFYLSKLTDNILAFTIGGREINEIPNAKKLAKQYDIVAHTCSVVSEDKLNYFPDIVWKTEGYVCESGLFLQYELAGLLKQKGLTNIICGECADQIVDQCRLKIPIKRYILEAKLYLKYVFLQYLWPEIFRETKLFKILRRPTLKIDYDIELDYILKKNGLILNSFDVQGFYPFLNREVADISGILGRLNKQKLFFKQELRKIFGNSIMELLNKAGGTTDIVYLFDGYEEVITHVLNQNEIKSVVSRRRRNMIKKDPMANADKIIRLLYIYLFIELFLSGEYDAKFKDVNLDISLKDILKRKNRVNF